MGFLWGKKKKKEVQQKRVSSEQVKTASTEITQERRQRVNSESSQRALTDVYTFLTDSQTGHTHTGRHTHTQKQFKYSKMVI